MSYCRFSCLNGYCSVYVYQHVDGGWVTHVAAMGWPPGRPEGFSDVVLRGIEAGGDVDQAAADRARALQEAWDAQNPLEPIDHADAGRDFQHSTPGECADNLERLRLEGFTVPSWAIAQLREEEQERDGTSAR